MLYLVRHAKAGSRRDWPGDDRARPLSKNGRAQAEALAARLLDAEAGPWLVSSEYLRCVQTLEPLGRLLGVAVETDARLTEGARFEATLELLGDAPDGTVLCSHGDVIPDTIAAIQRRGCKVLGQPDWRKGSVWVIERQDGELVEARVWPPPA